MQISTKDPEFGLNGNVQKVLPKLLKELPGVEIKTIGFNKDHLHMDMVIPPKYSIGEVMGRLKSQSASALRKKFTRLKKVYWDENLIWSPGYFVSSVGVGKETIRK